ncbi:MAG: uroporphyrinogen decarboxylase family protein [Verrucomicrobiota bacterium]|jgi:Uroporphyrinogen decarboxylase (URO-D)
MNMQPSVPTIVPQEQVRRVLRRERPDRVVYAPNYWQWFAHQQNHGLLPPEIAHCRTQLDLIRHLGLDVFSRNIYCDQQHCWFGGLTEEVWDGVEACEEVRIENRDRVITRNYATRRGTLTERQRYVFADSTLVQEKFLLDDTEDPLGALEELLRARRWRFLPERYAQEQGRVGHDGFVVAGELWSPLKALHLLAGAVNSTYLIADDENRVKELLRLHEAAQLDLVRQMAAAGVPAMMAMDNLDAAFHTPAYLEKFSASFYEQASRIAHAHGSTFFIHACGRQRINLKLMDSLGVDGLEGVAYPPLGDVQLDEAMALTSDRFLITGGISAMETEKFQSAGEVRRYLEDLFGRLRPYSHRFMLAASCNTSIRTPWKVIQWFRDAWQELSR